MPTGSVKGIALMRRWSYQRQRLGRAGPSATDVLKDIIGVYSVHPSAPLSLFARVRSFKPENFYQLETKRQALRLPAMRLSVYMLPAATAMRCLSATVPPPDDPYWAKRYAIIPETNYNSWRDKIIKLVTKPMTPDEIRTVAGIPAERAKGVSVAKGVFNRMAYEGSLLRLGSASLRSGKLLYVAANQWVKGDWARVDAGTALVWLAREYLRAFGPARIKDFQWWAGVTATKAKEAIAPIKTVAVGDGFLLLQEDTAKYENFREKLSGAVDILPPWDSYTMGYAPDGRERLVSPDRQSKVYGKVGATGGNALGVIMVDGLVHGTWNAHFIRDAMKIQTDMFEKPTSKIRDDIADEFEKIAAFLGAQRMDISK